MAKRHTFNPFEITSVVERLQELVMAHSGEDTFEEIFKMLVAKIHCELRNPDAWKFGAGVAAAHQQRDFNRVLAEAIKEWPGILERDFESSLKPEHLVTCLEVLNGVRVSGAEFEALDHAFEFLVSHASKGEKGQYFTPRHVIECCIRMLDPQPDETIFDPACGSGGFLFHAIRHVRNSHRGLDAAAYAGAKVWGTDFDGRAVKTARALLLLAGAPEANIFRINSLLKPAGQAEFGDGLGRSRPLNLEETLSALMPKFKGFDIIATNPPFAGEINEKDTLESYDLAKGGRRTERDVLFIERCIDLLRPGGRLAIVVPDNKVGAAAYAYVREWLVHRARILSVVGLGRETFLPHTHQKTSIIVCEKRPATVQKAPTENILFQVSTRSGKDGRGKFISRAGTTGLDPIWQRVDHDLGEVVDCFSEFRQSDSIEW